LNTVHDQPGNGFSGLAIGLTVLGGVLAFGDLATGLFNPSLPLGLYIGKLIVGNPFHWLDLLGVLLLALLPFVGGLLAVLANSFNANPDKPAVLVTEFVGSFFLVLCLLKAPGSTGLVYVGLVYFGAHVSHAHYNPAVTLSHYLAGKCSLEVLWRYALVQTGGAMLAGAMALSEGDALPLADPEATPLVIASVECLVSFAIILVHLNVLGERDFFSLGGTTSLHAARPTNDHYGIAVGFTFLAGFTAVRSVSGGLFNPAAGLGLYLARVIAGHSHTLALGGTLYYVLMPCLAALLAKQAYRYQREGGARIAHLLG
jgi:aquaporin Z